MADPPKRGQIWDTTPRGGQRFEVAYPTRVKGARYASFTTREEAEAFCQGLYMAEAFKDELS
jgi:Caulimovirus viroplasmin